MTRRLRRRRRRCQADDDNLRNIVIVIVTVADCNNHSDTGWAWVSGMWEASECCDYYYNTLA